MDDRRSGSHHHHHHKHHHHHHHHHRHHHRNAEQSSTGNNWQPAFSNSPSPNSSSSHSHVQSGGSTKSGVKVTIHAPNNSHSTPSTHHPPSQPHQPHPFKGRNFKLLVDPLIVKGSTKLYRIEGFVSQDSSWNVTSVKDPRSSLTRIWTRLETIDLPIPRLKVDGNYVGEPPALEVTITNLNDNIDRQFLSDIVSKFGEIEELTIFYHPVTHKHLGIARVVFYEVADASACVQNLNSRPVMGKKLNVFRDSFGKECKKIFEELTGENKPQPSVEPEKSVNLPTPSSSTSSALGNGGSKLDATSDHDPLVTRESDRKRTPPLDKEDSDSNSKMIIAEEENVVSNDSFALPSPAVNNFPPVMLKTPTHIPPPVMSPFSPFTQQRMPYPAFHGRPPHWAPQPPQHFPNTPPPPQWNCPMPPQPSQPWTPPPRFLSPPQMSVPPPNLPVPPPSIETPSTLDLDTRIELLLKGSGMAPPFLAMDINSDETEDTVKPVQDEAKGPPQAKWNSDSSDEAYSPPPLPPGEDPPSPPMPPPPLSPATPLTSPFPESSNDRYAPLSPIPSPFLSDELYLESLITWRLKHLTLVKQRQKEVSKRRKRSSHRDSDKMSEISSEEDEADFRRPSRDDDRMSLSSLSSTGEKIEEVSVPSNPYGSYTFGNVAVAPAPVEIPRTVPERDFNLFLPPPDRPPFMWGQYPPGYRYPGPDPSYPIPPEPQSHMPRMLPMRGYTPPTLMPPPPQFEPRLPPPEEVDLRRQILEGALSQIRDLVKTTLEKDILKRMTEVLAFNELEDWWENEEKKFKAKFDDNSKEKVVKDEVSEEKKATTESLLNSIIDAGFDGGYSSTGFSLGFRAALPKLPSFRRKVKTPSPERNYDIAVNGRVIDANESDEEEMVQQSDSESKTNEPESMMVKRRRRRESSSNSSESRSSESSSSESEEGSSDAESITAELELAKEDFLNAVDSELLERLREKTPEARTTPIPSDSVSDDGSEDFSRPPKTPDIHLSDAEELPRTPSPSGNRRLRNSAMEALITLGLDEFVCDIKIRNDLPKPARTIVRTPSPTFPSSRHRKSKSRSNDNIIRSKKIRDKAKGRKDNAASIDVYKKEKIERAHTPVIEKTEQDAASVKADDFKLIEDDSDTTESLIALEHSYSRPKDSVSALPSSWALDHDYSLDRWSKKFEKESSTKERKKSSEKLVSHLLDAYLKPEPAPVVYSPRDPLEEMMKCYQFLTQGVDEEDIMYLKRKYDRLLTDETQSYWLNDTHWVPHPITDVHSNNNKRQRPHVTGCARTQGYYKMDALDKQRNRHHYNKNRPTVSGQVATHGIRSAPDSKGGVAASREARSNQRRLLTAFGTDTDSDLLKFNQLKFRKKLLKFSKSEIHDWGLFAMETIAADEMVIEYVGQRVRPFLADFREKGYEKRGIGSSYLFRIDLDAIIDATRFGNLARFINHSCNPNCYAKIITIEGRKKIVIYSKREIQVGEEITYDYKFPLEEEKIVCLCGASQCKGFLN